MKKWYGRLQRRRAKQKLVNKAAVRAHTKIGGRTGGVQSHRVPAQRVYAYKHLPNPEPPDWINHG